MKKENCAACNAELTKTSDKAQVPTEKKKMYFALA